MIVPVPWEQCADKSREIHRVLERWAPVVEQASSDEFYLDLSGTEKLYAEPLAETARKIRDAVHAATALWVSIGGGTSRLVAKLAAGAAKPTPTTPATGVHVVLPGAELAFMQRFSLADLPLVGPRFQERLQQLGWRTVPDVLPRERAELVARLGEREGTWLWERVRGIDESPVEAWSEPKSLSRDTTFPRDLETDDDLTRELLALVDVATSDLRAEGLLARTVSVRLRDADFTNRQASRTLAEPVCTDRAVFTVARELLARLRTARRVPARLVGVALSQLVRPKDELQLALLEAEAPPGVETGRDRSLAKAIDAVRNRFGPDALGRARTR
jgi:DNA polymerase-4